MNFSIICVGRLKDKFFEDASAEYIKRIRAYGKISVTEIPAVNLPDNPSDTEIKKALKKEAEAILSKIPSRSVVVPMCIEGKLLSSEELAQVFDKSAIDGNSEIVFIIGGSYGLDESVKSVGRLKLSMSKMTFPHRLARVMLLEQIYRACTINAGKTYHK